MALTTAAIFRSDYLYDTDTSKDTELGRILGRAQSMLDAHLNRTLETATYTSEEHDGDGECKTFYLRHYPVTALTSVTVDDSALTEDEDFYLYDSSGRLELEGAPSKDFKNILVTYTAGYSSSTIPAVLGDAIYRIALYLWKQTKLGGGEQGVASRTAAAGSISYLQTIFRPEELQAINFYRNLRL